MDFSSHLLVHNVGYIISGILIFGISILIFFKNRKSVINRFMMFSFLCILVFILSHVIGVNILNSHISRIVLTLNLSTIFIGVFLTHSILLMINRYDSQKPALVVIYGFSVLLSLFYLIFPNTFLLDSVPKLYFPNYYQAGSLYWVMVLWNTLVAVYLIVQMLLSYKTANLIDKNRIRYLLIGVVLGYAFGSTAYLLVLNISVDPIFSTLMAPLFSFFFTYAVLKYELIDIKIVAKQALVYFVLIESTGIVISLLILFVDYIREVFPLMPIWILPATFSVIFVFFGTLVWRRLSESDTLKYEFITVVTHKFRTPLTHIKWAAEDIAPTISEEKKEGIDVILESERQLLSLTDILVHLSEADTSTFQYHPKPIEVQSIFADLGVQYSARADRKQVKLSFNSSVGLAVLVDPERSSFIFQILLDNALVYTPKGGSIVVSAHTDVDLAHVVIQVSDTGIGMSRETAARVFKRFYRGDNARHADTEGMGIGLFMAKSIVEKQGGKISVYSDGEGKGSTFSIRLPIARVKYTQIAASA